jgi:hypothetical protein
MVKPSNWTFRFVAVAQTQACVHKTRENIIPYEPTVANAGWSSSSSVNVLDEDNEQRAIFVLQCYNFKERIRGDLGN